jgi:alanyl-tRNA synthetase
VNLLRPHYAPARSLVKNRDWRYAWIVTERLYYGDSSALIFDARIVGVQTHEGRCEVELDRTAFYPGGGGQPCDIGSLGASRVIETGWRGETIVHVVEPAFDANAVGGPAHGSVDPAHRLDFMVQHTGQHIFSQALVRAGTLDTVSVHFGSDDTTIELRADEVSPKVLREAEDIANAIVTDNRRLILHEVDRAEASRFPLRRTPPDEARLRIVEVESFDWAACGGVHVARTGEVGLIKAASQERIRGRVRVHVMIGRRAFDDYARKIELTRSLSRSLTCGEDSIGRRVEELITRDRESTRELRRLRLAQAAADADDSVSAAPCIGAVPCVRRLFNAAGGEYLKAFVERVVDVPGRICIAIDRLDSTFQWIVAHSLGDGLDLARIVPGALGAADAKGGGSAARMQGLGARRDAAAQLADAIEAELGRVLRGGEQ